MTAGQERGSDEWQMAESQPSELQNMGVLLKEATELSRSLAYHRRAPLEAILGETSGSRVSDLGGAVRDLG